MACANTERLGCSCWAKNKLGSCLQHTGQPGSLSPLDDIFVLSFITEQSHTFAVTLTHCGGGVPHKDNVTTEYTASLRPISLSQIHLAVCGWAAEIILK